MHHSLLIKKIFGDKQFLKTFFKLFIPAAFQSMLSVIVLYVDNFAISTLVLNHETANLAKEALGLASPIIDFLVLVVCAWIGGIGIIFSQYFGNQDLNSIKKTVCLRIWSSLTILIPFIVIMATLPGKLIVITSNVKEMDLVYELARIYLFYSSFTFIIFAISVVFTFSLQETKRATISFFSSLIGVITNLILDPIVILLVKDINVVIMLVALSTGLARLVQVIFVILYIYFKKDKYLWFFNSWKISLQQIIFIIKYGLSVFINETIYAICAMLMSICLLSFNPNIHDATTNLILMIQFTTMIWPGMSAASSVLIGSELGAKNITKTKTNAKNLFTWGIIISTTLGLIMFILAIFINNVLSPAASQDMIILSRDLEWVMAPIIVTQGVSAIAYNIIKSGGSKYIIIIDSGINILWLTFVLPITFTNTANNFNPLWFLFLLESNQIAKMIVSIILLKYIKWAKVLV